MKVTTYSNNLFRLTQLGCINCYLLREEDGFTLIDTAYTGTFEILFPLPAMSTWHKGLALERARKLLALQPTALAVGHGRVLSQPQAAMQRAIHVMEQSLAKEQRKQSHVA
jgi:hypothetical protein